jgi:hypothetical protein
MQIGERAFLIYLEFLKVKKGVDCEGVTNFEVKGPFKGFVNGNGTHFDFLIRVKVKFRDGSDVLYICKIATVAKDRRIGRAVGKETGVCTNIPGFLLKFAKTGFERGFAWVNNSTRNFP